jgi:hypothetical protein
MTNFNTTPAVTPRPNTASVAAARVRPSLTVGRWTSRRTHPRLVSFSWGDVAPMPSRR